MKSHSQRLTGFVYFALFATFLIQSGRAAEFFVAPTGNDSATGTAAQPFASFARAQAAVRSARKAKPDEGVTVTFNAGVYAIDHPLQFTPLDSGVSAQQPVIYRAAPGAEVTVSGGYQVTGWQADSDHRGVWKARLETPSATNPPASHFDQLWVNGQWAVRARTPDWWHFARLEYVTQEPGGADPLKLKHLFKVAPEALASLRGLSPDELHDVQVVVFHKWDTTREPLQSVSPAKGLFTTSGVKMKSWNKMGPGCLYYLENWMGALDAPGEWFLNRQGWLFYRPRPGEDMTQAEAIVPRVGQFLSVQGESGNRVQHLHFDGLKFKYAGLMIPKAGYAPAQAAMNEESTAIQLDDASDIVFTNCAIEHAAPNGIWFRQDCQDCCVEQTRLCDLGVSGVRIGERKIVPEAMRTGRITLKNCIIQGGGLIRPDAAAVVIGQSGDNVISHCDIGDFTYTAISAGWTYGYTESASKRNRFEYNHLHDLGHGILSDMGGVYTLGNSEGTVVRNNVIHDISAAVYGGWGLYADEGTTGILYENNLVYDTFDGAIHQHFGKENIFRNNIFALSQQGQIALTRPEPHLSFTFERNLVYWTQGQLLGNAAWNNGPKVILQTNLYWQAGGQSFDFKGKTWEQWRTAGNDAGSIIEDPLFRDVSQHDFRLQPGSPAAKIGFEPFDPSQAGVEGDAAWRQLAAKRFIATTPTLAPYKPIEIRDDFKSHRTSPFFGIATLQQGKGHDLITVVNDPTSNPNHCLKIQDDPGLKANAPHWFCEPHYVTNQGRLDFKIWLEADASVTCEWRSTPHSDYVTGPNVAFKQGAVLLSGHKVMDIPTNTWIQVEMRAPLGRPKSQWEMSLTLPGAKTRVFRELPCNPAWTEAQWIGFISHRTKKTAYYLTDLTLENR